jgi:hypothetical protein
MKLWIYSYIIMQLLKSKGTSAAWIISTEKALKFSIPIIGLNIIYSCKVAYDIISRYWLEWDGEKVKGHKRKREREMHVFFLYFFLISSKCDKTVIVYETR